MRKRTGRPPVYGIPMTQLCATCPVHLLAAVDEIATQQSTSRSRVLRDAITAYLEQRPTVK
jgi:metal-responsive CopG/Arc/MetJ family transcriptional regulator